MTFTCDQITPNSLSYRGSSVSKNEVKKIEGIVRTPRRKDFDMDTLEAFAYNSAKHALEPPVERKSGAVYKGMHNGAISKNINRSHRKSHSARKAQIVARSMGDK